MRKCVFTFGCIVLITTIASRATAVAGEGEKTAESGRKLTVAAAADLKFALDDINKEFNKANSRDRCKSQLRIVGQFFHSVIEQGPVRCFSVC